MRTRVSMVIAVAVVMCLTAVVEAQPGGGRGRGGGGFGGFGGIGKLQLLRIAAIQKELELTDDQIAAITKLQEEMRADSPFGGGRGSFQGRGRGNGEGGNRPRGGDGEGRRRRPQPEDDDNSRLEFQPGEYFVQDEQPPRRGQQTDEERQQRMEEFRKRMEERRKKEEEGVAKILLPHQVKRLNQIAIQMQGMRALQNPEVVKELKITEKQQEKMREVQESAREKMREEIGELFRTDREKAMEKFAEIREDIDKDVLGVLSKKQQKQFEEMKGKPFEMSDEDRRGAFGFGGRGGPQGGQRGRPQGGRGRPEAAPDA